MPVTGVPATTGDDIVAVTPRDLRLVSRAGPAVGDMTTCAASRVRTRGAKLRATTPSTAIRGGSVIDGGAQVDVWHRAPRGQPYSLAFDA